MEFVNFTSEEQIKKLIKAGIDINSADYTLSSNIVVPHDPESKRGLKELPCWSLGRLFQIIPSEIILNPEDKTTIQNFKMTFCNVNHVEVCYENQYLEANSYYIDDDNKNIIDVLVSLICKLLQDNLLKGF